MTEYRLVRIIAFILLAAVAVCACAEAFAIPAVKGPQGVIYGRRLTKKHAHGDRTSLTYGASDLKDGSGSASYLEVADGVPGIVLDDGDSDFVYELKNNTLSLAPADSGIVWTVPAGALEALELSGRTTVTLRLGDQTLDIPTSLKPMGYEWGKLRTKGYVWPQCVLEWNGRFISVELDGVCYFIDTDGNFSAVEEAR